MTTEAWFVSTNMAFDISCVELDVISTLGGKESSMWDVISYDWTVRKKARLQRVYPGSLEGYDLTPNGTRALWVATVGRPLNERIAAIILHQLQYQATITLCYDWYALLWADGHKDVEFWQGRRDC